MANNDEKVVRITLDARGMPIATPDPVKVKKDTHKVSWCADFQFAIAIEGKPSFSSAKGSGDCAHNSKTGPFTDLTGTKPLKYSITANGQTNDPEIEVEP